MRGHLLLGTRRQWGHPSEAGKMDGEDRASANQAGLVYLVLQVEGILVGGGGGIGDGAQVLHGEAPQPSGQCALTLQKSGISCTA